MADHQPALLRVRSCFSRQDTHRWQLSEPTQRLQHPANVSYMYSTAGSHLLIMCPIHDVACTVNQTLHV